MNETDLCFTPATELADAIRAKKLSAVEITTAVLNRITRLEPKLNAFAYLAAEEAMDAAQKPPIARWPRASRSGRCTACR